MKVLSTAVDRAIANSRSRPAQVVENQFHLPGGEDVLPGVITGLA